MRLNVFQSAALVFAGLLLMPATLLAKPAHHVARHAAHHSAAAPTAARKRTHERAADDAAAKPHRRRKKSRRRQQDTLEPVNISRVRARSHAQAAGDATHLASTEDDAAPLSAADTAPRKATSEDFVRAASGLPAEPDNTGKSATGVSRPQEDNEAAPRTPATGTTPPAAEPSASEASVRRQAVKPAQEANQDDASAPIVQPTLYNRRGRLIVPPPLKGSHEILVRQNVVADSEGLSRIKDDDDLNDMRAQRLLVSLPVSNTLQVDDRLPANRRYCRPWTARFLASLAQAHYARFHTPLQVNSAVRTVEFQQRLQHVNGNAAPAEGETASPHLTGQAVDLAKHGLSMTEIAWMRGYLRPLVQQGKIDVEEEFQQSCFHISVYKRYLPSPAAKTPRRDVATTRHGGTTTALAAAIR